MKTETYICIRVDDDLITDVVQADSIEQVAKHLLRTHDQAYSASIKRLNDLGTPWEISINELGDDGERGYGVQYKVRKQEVATGTYTSPDPTSTQTFHLSCDDGGMRITLRGDGTVYIGFSNPICGGVAITTMEKFITHVSDLVVTTPRSCE